ncbi:hypothetical protein IFM12276_40660 [Nocardia sputorum]|uniref:Uncharacterized protein n=1 Tax=Nocardia sputorum TaxID=2984338 RepID=A0ABN6U6X9_9NOCA|nr:hypothetical protein IFM12276_40660 [Nocardia sputorum]
MSELASGPNLKRWTAWAHTKTRRARRHGRVHRPSQMTLLRRPVVRAEQSRTRQQFSFTAHLHLTVRARTVMPRPPAGHGSHVVIEQRSTTRSVLAYRHDTAVPGVGLGRPSSEPMRARAFGYERWDPQTRATPKLLPATRPPAVAVAASDRAEARLPAVCRKMIMRVAYGHRRIESPVRPTALPRNRPAVGVEVDRASRDVARRGVGIPGFGPVASSPSPALPPPVDLDGLTEQIVTRLDDRLTAHRERFGRAF